MPTIIDGSEAKITQPFDVRWNVAVIIRRKCKWCDKLTEGHNNPTNTAWRCNNCGSKFLVIT